MTVKICYHCNHDRYPKGKPLFDLAADSAVPDKHGGWKCSECVKDSLNKEILRYAPNSPAARDIIAARKRQEEFQARYERMKKQPGERLSYYHGQGWKEYPKYNTKGIKRIG